ncbi:hypothetical protein CEXT_593551 [Caerostris extrusa]|uniref:Uncharacterized protein n=1 Tax=Caerostris extrusa TaxID=172846 RepID=A0AAV4NM49_CAEEX|nr:hypothetical protein CEXT_593551 [Caerostris extrusa]
MNSESSAVEDYGGGGSKEYNLQRPSTDSLEPTEKQFGEGLPRLPSTTLQIKKKKRRKNPESFTQGMVISERGRVIRSMICVASFINVKMQSRDSTPSSWT